MTPDLPLTLYVDRSCPLCAREVRWLERQADPTRLRLVDISAAGFDPAGLGVDLPQLRRRLHARSASGIWLTGVDATYWSWCLAGHGRWAAPLGWQPLRRCCGSPTTRSACCARIWTGCLTPDGAQRCAERCAAPSSKPKARARDEG